MLDFLMNWSFWDPVNELEPSKESVAGFVVDMSSRTPDQAVILVLCLPSVNWKFTFIGLFSKQPNWAERRQNEKSVIFIWKDTGRNTDGCWCWQIVADHWELKRSSAPLTQKYKNNCLMKERKNTKLKKTKQLPILFYYLVDICLVEIAQLRVAAVDIIGEDSHLWTL